jgi:hypothetical protein
MPTTSPAGHQRLPLPKLLRIEYTPTLADLKEALSPPAVAPSPKIARFISYTKAILATSFLIALAIFFYLLQKQKLHLHVHVPNSSQPPSFNAAPQDLLATLIPSWIPCLLLLTLLLPNVYRRRAKPNPDPVPQARRTKFDTNLFLSALLILVGFALVALVFPSISIPWHPTRDQQIGLGCLPWLILTAFLRLFFSRQQSILRLWNANSVLRSPATADFDPAGLTVTQEFISVHFQWPHFATFRETTNLFLLITRDNNIHFFPKRALPDPQSLDALRNHLQSVLPHGSHPANANQTRPPSTASASLTVP